VSAANRQALSGRTAAFMTTTADNEPHCAANSRQTECQSERKLPE
jgi:hypothetical protein